LPDFFIKTFETIRKLYKNRLQRYSFCRNEIDETKITEEEIVLGSREKALELGLRFSTFENDETYLEDALTYLFLNRKLKTKANYPLDEVVEIVKEAIAERNNFLRECANQYKKSTAPLNSV
jgi:hypothetical protein